MRMLRRVSVKSGLAFVVTAARKSLLSLQLT